MRLFQSFRDQIKSFWFWLTTSVLIAVWLIFFVLIPPFQTSDEFGHYTFIQSLAHGNYPYLTKASCWSKEINFFAKRYQMDDQTILFESGVNQPIPPNLDDAAVCSSQAQQPPLYYAMATVVYNIATFFNVTGLDRYNLVRLTSMSFFILFLGYAGKLFGLFFEKRLVRLMWLLLILQPMLLALSIQVNPEISVVALSTVTLYYLSLFLLKKQFSLLQVVGLAVLCVLTFYAKVSGVIMVPLTVFAILFLTQANWQKKGQQLLLFLSIVGLFLAPYFLWNLYLYDKPLESGLTYFPVESNFPEKVSLSMKFFYLIDDMQIGLLQTAGDIAGLYAPTFANVRVVYLFVLLALCGWGVYTVFSKLKRQPQWSTHRWLFTVHIGLTLLFYAYLGYTSMNQAWAGPLLQADSVFVGVGSFLMLSFFGAMQLFNIESSRLFKCFILLSIFHFNLMVLWSIVPRFYL